MTITGNASFAASAGALLGSRSTMSRMPSIANATRFEMRVPRRTVSIAVPGPAPVASIITVPVGRFHPDTSTAVFARAGPPSGNTLVTNGSSPMDRR